MKELINDLNRLYDLELTERLSMDGLETLLAEKLNALIHSDFNALVSMLYRIDVNEARLKELLKTNAGEDAGRIMARLIIERQAEKVKTRKDSRQPRPNDGADWQDT